MPKNHRRPFRTIVPQAVRTTFIEGHDDDESEEETSHARPRDRSVPDSRLQIGIKRSRSTDSSSSVVKSVLMGIVQTTETTVTNQRGSARFASTTVATTSSTATSALGFTDSEAKKITARLERFGISSAAGAAAPSAAAPSLVSPGGSYIEVRNECCPLIPEIIMTKIRAIVLSRPGFNEDIGDSAFEQLEAYLTPLKMRLSRMAMISIRRETLVQRSASLHGVATRNGPIMRRRYESGESIVTIAAELDLPPFMCFRILLGLQGMPKAHIKNFLSGKAPGKTPRDTRERDLVMASDNITGPPPPSQSERADAFEAQIEELLRDVKVDFMTQADLLRAKKDAADAASATPAPVVAADVLPRIVDSSGVLDDEAPSVSASPNPATNLTPDFLIQSPLRIGELSDVKWIDAKAFFGGVTGLMEKKSQVQFKKYLDTFGPGVVCYAHGSTMKHAQTAFPKGVLVVPYDTLKAHMSSSKPSASSS